MTWTYSTADLATSTKDQVRLEIGDTNTNAQLLQDEEINQAIKVEMNMWGAAARCCEILSRRLLIKADVRIGRGGTTLNYSSAAQQYAAMAAALRKRATALNPPWTGGTSISDKESLAADPNKVQPIFTKTSGANPYIGGFDLDPNADGQEDFA